MIPSCPMIGGRPAFFIVKVPQEGSVRLWKRKGVVFTIFENVCECLFLVFEDLLRVDLIQEIFELERHSQGQYSCDRATF